MKNYTDITIILDRSGSMHSIASDTIGGFNKFLADQKAVASSRISLVQFDDQIEPLYTNRPITEAEPLDTNSFVPRGSTALLDAIGRTVAETGRRLAALPESERPERVVCAIITDGLENASKEYNRAKVNAMIKHQTDAYKWQFVYLGANQDAIKEAQDFGIHAGNAMTYHASAQGMTSAIGSLSANVRSYASGATMDCMFVPEDRKEQDKLLQQELTK